MNKSTFYTFLLLFILFGAAAPVWSQQARIDIRAVNLVSGVASADVFILGSEPAYITNLQYGFASQNGRIPTDTSTPFNLRFVESGGAIGSAFLNKDAKIAASTAYAAVAYGTKAAPKMKVLARPYTQVPQPGKSLVRILNATTMSKPLDFYFGIFGGNPAFGGIPQDSATPFSVQDFQPTLLTIAEQGSTTAMVDLVAGLSDGGIVTLVVTGSSASDLKVYQFNNDGQHQDEYELPLLGKAGSQPVIRTIDALPPELNPGADSVDVYFENALQTHGLRYRGSSAVSTPLTVDSVNVKFVMSGHDPQSGALLTVPVELKRDTAYEIVLTQFTNGAIVPLTIKTGTVEFGSLGDVLFRVANATDFFGPLTFVLNPGGPNEARFESIPFLGVSDWDTIPAGNLRIAMYQEGATMPFYTGSYPTNGGEVDTYIAIGDTTKRDGDTLRFSVDVLTESSPNAMKRMFTFDGPLAAVPLDLAAGASSLGFSIAPNPLNGPGSIGFTLPRAGRTSIELYDALGRRTATLLEGWREAGAQSVPFSLEGLPSGAYTCVMQTADGARGARQILVVR